jgi:pimeloyl-ACP methyl ester carboxylesterase
LSNGESVGAIGARPLDAARSNRWNYRKQRSFFATLRCFPNHPYRGARQPRNQGGNVNWLPSAPFRPAASSCSLTAPWQDAQIGQPPLFIAGWQDAIIIEGAGRWVQQERPAEVNAALIGFLKQNAPLRSSAM